MFSLFCKMFSFPLRNDQIKKAAQGHLILHILSIADRQSVLYAANVTTEEFLVLTHTRIILVSIQIIGKTQISRIIGTGIFSARMPFFM